eukprot:CAMPEP_0172530054 /NCGR_PEP_ID=MMETSP1067-20121228/3921_1 /TAXON_ID=265564 ORGANISM="Thalassiosira punctigera, Strain Tpunct2005C2" /NCGR_SAMPLE_ID=MMETSP1067 /ASSEMBLY_ACC=CAM_ASM_000444 /LENGTH=1098 /DNA_ID=CAMNT_0013314197 /DNA_START=169 /DNA_END=3465 /DNA_ORIENTATION=+
MNSLPQNPRPQSATAQEFVPEKISVKSERRERRGGGHEKAGATGGAATGGENDNIHDCGGAGQRLDDYQASQPAVISSSVVFHEDIDEDLDDMNEFLTHYNGGGKVMLNPKNGHDAVAPSSSDQRPDSHRTTQSTSTSSVVFHEECDLFDEIDELFPHDYEGGKIVADPNPSNNSSASTSCSRSESEYPPPRPRLADSGLSTSRTRSVASSLLQSLQNSSLVDDNDSIPTDYESLVASSTDGALAQLISGIEDRYKASTALSRSSIHSNIMGNEGIGRGSNTLSQGTGSKRESIVGGSPPTPSPNDHVDWASLSKSCKRAKNAFRDADSGQMVVKNMFFTHLGPLITALERYCGSNGTNDGSGDKCVTLNDINARTKETKRALRFAMACLVPRHVEEDSTPACEIVEEAGQDAIPNTGSFETQYGIEKYRFTKRYRQELQEAAVKGLTSRLSSPAEDGELSRVREPRHYGLQLPLVEIIFADKSLMEDNANLSTDEDKDKHAAIKASIEREKRAVRTLSSRLLCNLVTDNPLTAEIILRDVPFSPTPEQIDERIAGSMLGPGGRTNKTSTNQDEAIFWCDLIDATARVEGVGAGKNGRGKRDDDLEDREALAAVAAALHNLLTSLEARESLIELNDEMKRRKNAKQHQEVTLQDHVASRSSGIGEAEVEHCSMKHIDAGFEVASSGPLLNALLRNILPAKAVVMQSKFEMEHTSVSRPKFKPPASSTAPDNMSDSATEWISLVLERLASRGLLPHMFQTAAGGVRFSFVTPEQVVLASCIRQAVDDYHSSLSLMGDAGGFGRRRLSIEANTAGMTVTTRPHPLWGRADNIGAGGRANQGRDSRTAVPVLLSLANEAEEIRLRANALRVGKSDEVYDGEQNCSIRIIDDICDILAQSLGRHASYTENQRSKLCFIAEARSVIGRETSLISSCCKDLARILDTALERNSGRKARELMLSPQDQQTAVVMVRLIANLIYQCRHNQDLLRISPVPKLQMANETAAPSDAASTHLNINDGLPIERTGLHVILSATSLAPACFTLREWCIVAIRNAIEGNAANAETVRRLEANQVLDDTPELQRIGVKVEMDGQGNVHVKRRDS